ncbi:hypothetical protein BKP29_0206735 [Bacillus licheniformis]|nr:hypothetical protein BKP29_0206735 [Bacillus licheniformis]
MIIASFIFLYRKFFFVFHIEPLFLMGVFCIGNVWLCVFSYLVYLLETIIRETEIRESIPM